jgi:hypothetical protein
MALLYLIIHRGPRFVLINLDESYMFCPNDTWISAQFPPVLSPPADTPMDRIGWDYDILNKMN